MLSIMDYLNKSTKSVKFSATNIRPGQTIGIGVDHPTLVKLSVFEIDGKDTVLYCIPFKSSSIYATTDLKDLETTLLEVASMVILGSNRKGDRNKLTFKYLKAIQSNSDIICTDYDFVDRLERDELLSELKAKM